MEQEVGCGRYGTKVGGILVARLSPTGNPIPGCGCAGGSRRKLGKRAHPLPPPAPQNLAPLALAARFRPPPPGPLTSLSPAKIAANRSVYAVHSVWPPSIHKKARRERYGARRRERGSPADPHPWPTPVRNVLANGTVVSSERSASALSFPLKCV